MALTEGVSVAVVGGPQSLRLCGGGSLEASCDVSGW